MISTLFAFFDGKFQVPESKTESQDSDRDDPLSDDDLKDTMGKLLTMSRDERINWALKQKGMSREEWDEKYDKDDD